MTTRLFHISDVHFGVENRAALDEVARAVAAERPDAVVCTGDLTQRAKHSEYARAAEWFAALGVPVVLEPGNHDMPYYNPWERFTDPFRRYNRLREAVATTFVSNDVVLVPLLTTVRAQTRFPWSDGVIKPAALAQTLARLEALRGDSRSIVVTAHHPLLGPRDGEKNPTIGGDAAFAAIAAAGAHAVMSGHVHVPFDEVRTRGGRAMRMIGAGTLSTRLRHGAPPSWRVVTCEPGGVISSELRLVTEAAPA
ncbi:metallophosphoesterase family protein [Erythrobacter dokdonensis]|uniref:Metallophosphoesterase n=1 Tax=Erythrobacter dokdonensis DSW-74 TaxID=1300349 RepID=A0A1A7BGC9_9SPHN|nr:metallophosphoesterase [Erythrobacter dokdonensis]OBV10791.1 Metallophosphoesterase [Erythrobacter dokdonensis DSW-74]